MPPRATGAPVAAISARGITKRFGEVLANDRVDFDVRPGEVHALLGENGAGKSTLVKILYGFHRADAGDILLEGEPVQIRTPADARRLGIGMVFQHFTLIPAFTVAENIALHLPDLPRVLRMEAIADRIRDISARYGLSVDPGALVGRLSVGEQQRVEVLRVLLAGARILIFDEPTSVLAEHEIDALFDVFEKLSADGFPIVFITHKLREVFACADRVTVMRRGVVTGTVMASEATEERLVSLMFGRERPAPRFRRSEGPEHPFVLELRGVSTRGRGGVALRGLDLSVRPAEIVGVAGVAGNGQQELGDAILGVQRIVSGTRLLFGEDATGRSVRETRDCGVGFIPENPLAMTLVPGMTVQENVAIAATRRYARRGGFSMDWEAVRSNLAEAAEALRVALPEPTAPVGTLSGGTVQRFAVAAELGRQPRLLVALYPTKGLDVTTAAAVQELLMDARDRGAGILLISQDLGELIVLSDRIVVLRGGRIVGEFRPETADPYEVGRLMTGAEA